MPNLLRRQKPDGNARSKKVNESHAPGVEQKEPPGPGATQRPNGPPADSQNARKPPRGPKLSRPNQSGQQPVTILKQSLQHSALRSRALLLQQSLDQVLIGLHTQSPCSLRFGNPLQPELIPLGMFRCT